MLSVHGGCPEASQEGYSGTGPGGSTIHDASTAHLQDHLTLRIGRVRETVSRREHGGWFRPPELHLLQVVAGEFDLDHPACKRRTLRAGQAVLVGPGVRYFVRVRSPQTAPIRYAHVDPRFFDTLPLSEVAELPVVLPPRHGRPLGDAIADCERTRLALDGSDLATLSADRLAAARLLHEIMRHAVLHDDGQRLLRGALRLRPVVTYMRDHLHHPLTRQTLAAIAGLSPSRFSAVFAKNLGMSPMRFLQRLRLQAARRDLLEAGSTVTLVAERYQFSDAFHLSKAFKTRYGISPRTWTRESTRFEDAADS